MSSGVLSNRTPCRRYGLFRRHTKHRYT